MSSKKVRAGGAFVELGVKDQLDKGLKRARAKLKKFAGRVNAIGRSMIRFGASLAIGLGLALKVFADFDDQMRIVAAVSGATGKEFDKLTEKAKELGRTTSFTASQVASAMVELGRAGFKPDQIDAAIEGVLNLSRATDTELALAAQIGGSILRGFSLDVSQFTRVVDVLTATANGSSQGLEDLFEAMKVVAPIAVEAGASIESTAAAMAVLANNGIKGSLAGTAIARAYKNLATTKAQKKLQEVGVSAIDSAGNLRSLSDILLEVGKATKGFGSGKRLAIFEELFGRGQAAALKLASAGAAFDDLKEKITNSSGVAKKAAADMDAGIGGSIRKLLSAIEGVAIAIGDALAPSVSKLAGFLASVSAWMTKFIDKNKFLAVLLGQVTAALIIGGAAFLLIGSMAALASFAITGLIAVISAVGAVIAFLLSPLGLMIAGIVLVVAAVVAATVAFFKFTAIGQKTASLIGAAFAELFSFLKAVFGGIRDALLEGNLVQAASILLQSIKTVWLAGILALKTAWEGLKNFTIGVFDKMAAAIIKRFSEVFRFAAGVVKKAADLTGSSTLSNVAAGLGALTDPENVDRAVAARDKARRQSSDRRLDDDLQALLKAQNDLARSIAAAAEARKKTETKIDDEIAGKVTDKIDAGAIGAAVEKASLKLKGTFSAAQAKQFGAVKRPTEEHIAEATKKTAEGVEELVTLFKRGGLTFIA